MQNALVMGASYYNNTMSQLGLKRTDAGSERSRSRECDASTGTRATRGWSRMSMGDGLSTWNYSKICEQHLSYRYEMASSYPITCLVIAISPAHTDMQKQPASLYKMGYLVNT